MRPSSIVCALAISLAAREATAQAAQTTPPVVRTASGLSYQVLSPGTGEPAKTGQTVTIHETTKLSNGTVVFDSYAKNTPITFLLGGKQVISGVDEGVTGMRVGEKRKLIIPPALSQRSSYPSNTPKDSTLYIDLELVGINEPTGFLNVSVTVDGKEFRYQVYVPREFTRATKWPVILALHGGGEYGTDGMRQTTVGLASAVRRFPDRFPAIIVFPQARPDSTPGWQLIGGRAAIAAVDKAVREFSGDSTRVYLTGYSAGGNGSLFLAAQYPTKFAAVVPVCPFVREFVGRASPVLYPSLSPASAGDPFAALAQRLPRVPFWFFHGDADGTVSPDESRNMVAALKAVGANVQYTELKGANHNAWDPAYENAELMVWLLKQRRTH